MDVIRSKKILVIDETTSSRHLVTRILHDAGYDLKECADAAEGLNILKEVKPDLLILDIKSKDPNVFAICSQLKNAPDTSHIPILMTSASFVDARDKVNGLESGADGYLATPYDPLEMIATVRSLLRIQETEKKLAENQIRLDLAMKGINDGLWDWNILTNEIYLSERFKAMLGYNDDELQSDVELIRSMIHPEDQEKVLSTVQNYIAQKTPEYRNIFRIQHKTGEYRWILSRGRAVYNQDNVPYRMVGAHTDITAQKELEQELIEASCKADTANRTKTEFLANMSHEIRTPMNAIIGLAHILSATTLDEKQKKFVSTLRLSADSMMQLINNMLDIAKIEDAMLELESIPFELRELIQRTMNMLEVRASEKALKLSIEYASNVGDSFLGDPTRIQQIIINLLNNAIKFTPAGNVTMSIRQTTSNSGAAQKISIKVTDTGIGIASEKLYTIFDKFTQSDSSMTRKYGGTGLGLTICKALVEQMGGNIHVASKLGQGSEFTVNIPLTACEPETGLPITPVISSDHAPTKSQQKRILLVEDYKANILVATSMLEILGYDYEIATNGNEALQKVMAGNYNAVLMDIQMQDMDGYEATRRIRKWEKERSAEPSNIIAMTAHALVGDREKCLDAGMNDYISKPFDPEELKLKLSSYMSEDELESA